jgi:hypothetical protein
MKTKAILAADTSLSVFKGVIDLESLGFPDDLAEFATAA